MHYFESEFRFLFGHSKMSSNTMCMTHTHRCVWHTHIHVRGCVSESRTYYIESRTYDIGSGIPQTCAPSPGITRICPQYRSPPRPRGRERKRERREGGERMRQRESEGEREREPPQNATEVFASTTEAPANRTMGTTTEVWRPWLPPKRIFSSSISQNF